MNLPHCVLLILNILFVTGHEDSKQCLLNKSANENNLENIKAIIDRALEESTNAYENSKKNIGIVRNDLKSNLKYKGPDENDVEKRLLDDDAVLLHDIESGRITRQRFRMGSFITNINPGKNGTSRIKVVNVTENDDVNDPNAQTWDHIDYNAINQKGKYKLLMLNEKGETTGTINISNNNDDSRSSSESSESIEDEAPPHRYKPKYKPTPSPKRESSESIENEAPPHRYKPKYKPTPSPNRESSESIEDEAPPNRYKPKYKPTPSPNHWASDRVEKDFQALQEKYRQVWKDVISSYIKEKRKRRQHGWPFKKDSSDDSEFDPKAWDNTINGDKKKKRKMVQSERKKKETRDKLKKRRYNKHKYIWG